IRVIGHEMNNSLAPIKSIAGSLSTITERDPLPSDWRDDVQRGLSVIASRSESLSRFMSAYARLAKLPPPKLAPIDISAVVDRVVTLEKGHNIRIAGGPRLTIQGDSDQLEQLLINLIRNAVDAVRETGGAVRVGWQRLPGSPASMELWVDDEGPGLSNTGNLFVPFFTTKPGGSGIGLVLSRQIAEAHGGSLMLENRDDRTGCRASLRLPLQAVMPMRIEAAGSPLVAAAFRLEATWSRNRGLMTEERSKPILPGAAATDYERYLRTDELLALQKRPDEVAHRDELLFQTVHQSSELWLKLACTEIEEAASLLAGENVPAAVRL